MRKIISLGILMVLITVLGTLSVHATNVYVVPPGTHDVQPEWVFTNWATAATNIQDAIDASHVGDGDIVFITNGLYLLTNQIVVNKGVVLRSYSNGMTAVETTMLDGNNYEGKPVTNRVLTLSHSQAVLDGLTLQGGETAGNIDGGGIMITASQMITNCIIRDNVSSRYGGGIQVNAPFGVITHSWIVSNEAENSGGGFNSGSSATGIVEYCEIAWNTSNATGGGHGGGGFRSSSPDLVVRWCNIHNNKGGRGGAGVLLYGADSSAGVVENSLIVSNISVGGDSGSGVRISGWGDSGGTVRNCLIAYNGRDDELDWRYAVALDSANALMENCTIARNYRRGFIGSEGVAVNSIIECDFDSIVMGNVAFTNCSASSIDLNAQGTGNIMADPLFVDPDGNFHLQSASPCINAGMNDPTWMNNAVDLDGYSRIDRLHRRVDIGAYEYLSRGTLYRLK